MNYEEMAENLVRKTVSEFKLVEEYQLFMDLAVQGAGIKEEFPSDTDVDRFRNLIDDLIVP